MDKTTYILDCSTEPSGVILFDGEVQTQLAILRRLNELDFENRQLKATFVKLGEHVAKEVARAYE